LIVRIAVTSEAIRPRDDGAETDGDARHQESQQPVDGVTHAALRQIRLAQQHGVELTGLLADANEGRKAQACENESEFARPHGRAGSVERTRRTGSCLRDGEGQRSGK
jgi:hypothetical protein